MVDQSEVADCPFCGADSAEIHPNDLATCGAQMQGAGPSYLHYAHCNGCGAEGPGAHSYGEAVELWNKRIVNEKSLTS